MNHPASIYRERSFLLFAFVVSLSTIALGYLYDPSFISNDGAQYVNIAKNIRDGNGVSTSIIFYDQHYNAGTIPAPQTVFAPGYSVLIALVTPLGISPEYGSFMISLASYALIALAIYWLVASAGHTAGMRFALSSGWLGFSLAWVYVFNSLSEFSFTLFTLLSLFYATKGEPLAPKRVLWLLLAGTFAGLALMTRYAGLFFILSLSGFFLLRLVQRRDKSSFRDLLIVSSIPALMVAGLFLHNYTLTGHFQGVPSYPADKGLFVPLQTLYWTISGLFGFSLYGLKNGKLLEISLAAFVLGLVAFLVVKRKQLHIDTVNLHKAFTGGYTLISIFYVLITLGALLFLAITTRSGEVMPRYLIPIIPFCLLLVGDLFRFLTLGELDKGSTITKRALMVGFVVVFLSGQYTVLRDEWAKLKYQNPYAEISRLLGTPYESSALSEVLARTVTTRAPLLANEPQILALAARLPVLGLTPAPYSLREWTSVEVAKIVSHYNVSYVLFFPALFDLTLAENSNQPFFKELYAEQGPPWLSPLIVNDRIRLYAVDQLRVSEHFLPH